MQINTNTPSFPLTVKAPSKTRSADDATTGNRADSREAQALQAEVEKLKATDREVRAHEQAHLSAAGGIAVTGAQFSFITGPDGQRYAVAGEVGIDVSAVPDDPQATLRKAETIRRAAMAPARPSSQDHAIASQAAAMAAQAAAEMAMLQADSQDKASGLDVTV